MSVLISRLTLEDRNQSRKLLELREGSNHELVPLLFDIRMRTPLSLSFLAMQEPLPAFWQKRWHRRTIAEVRRTIETGHYRVIREETQVPK